MENQNKIEEVKIRGNQEVKRESWFYLFLIHISRCFIFKLSISIHHYKFTECFAKLEIIEHQCLAHFFIYLFIFFFDYAESVAY